MFVYKAWVKDGRVTHIQELDPWSGNFDEFMSCMTGIVERLGMYLGKKLQNEGLHKVFYINAISIRTAIQVLLRTDHVGG